MDVSREGRRVRGQTVSNESCGPRTFVLSLSSFNYRTKGYTPGEFIAFGFGLHFPNNPEVTLDRVSTILKGQAIPYVNKGQAKGEKDEPQSHFVCPMSGRVHGLLREHGFKVINIVEASLARIVGQFARNVLEAKCEGFVISIPTTGEMYKWKRTPKMELAREFRLKEIREQYESLVAKHPRVANSIMGILADGAREPLKTSPSVDELTRAFESAVGKYPDLGDEEYVNIIVGEMKGDTDLDPKYEKKISNFVKQRHKEG